MTITYHNGLEISDMIGGRLVRKKYLDYELRQAVEAFAREFGIDITEDLTNCETCGVGVITDIWLEESGFCIECQHAYYTHEEEA